MNNIFFSVSKISFTYLMATFDFTNDPNTIRRINLGYIYKLKIETYIKHNTWNFVIFSVMLEMSTKLDG